MCPRRDPEDSLADHDYRSVTARRRMVAQELPAGRLQRSLAELAALSSGSKRMDSILQFLMAGLSGMYRRSMISLCLPLMGISMTDDARCPSRLPANRIFTQPGPGACMTRPRNSMTRGFG